MFQHWIFGGASRDRTGDLLHAMQALSQLSYGPTAGKRAILAIRARKRQANPEPAMRIPERWPRLSPPRAIPRVRGSSRQLNKRKPALRPECPAFALAARMFVLSAPIAQRLAGAGGFASQLRTMECWTRGSGGSGAWPSCNLHNIHYAKYNDFHQELVIPPFASGRSGASDENQTGDITDPHGRQPDCQAPGQHLQA